MAAPPLKSQPLHNFSFPDLKWARKNPSPASESTSQHHRDQNLHRRFAGNPSQSHTKTGNQPSPALPRNDVVLHNEEDEEEENGEGKPWNLRRRKEAAKVEPNPKTETPAENNEKKIVGNSNGVKSQRRRGLGEGGQMNGGGAERKEKSKLWISLSRREVEEDIYALTGGKPARRPRKWPKNVQKQLDNLFPGLYLVGVSPDSYQKGV